MTETTVAATATEAPLDYPMPRASGCPFDPPPQLARLREEAPFSRARIWDGTTAWLVTRYEDQRAILADDRFSANPLRPGFPMQSPGVAARRTNGKRLPFISMDDPEHNRVRRMFTSYFSVKRARALRPRLQEIIGDLLDGMEAAGPPVDLVSSFALPLPSLVIAEILGVPREDQPLFQRESRVLISMNSEIDDVLRAIDSLTDYLEGLLAAKERDPQDDLLSHVLADHVRSGATSREQLVQDAILLLIAGHETTTNMLALGTLALLRNPEQLAAVRDTEDPADIALAVEELLRYLTIVHTGRRRVALTDVEVSGQLIRAGEGVILPNDSANRDATVFDNPDSLDVTRQNARHHIAFGQGTHQCLGQNLARTELQLAYPALLRRFPTLRPAIEEDAIRYKHDAVVYGVYELPVAW
ncbi:cytochrome P450 [Streptomyces sulfonofaciens]|uniref:Cytochrome P450 n=1 Tax=Streptomyces sulfonofaciens TaxID=68272 RepID=A0A919L7L2_9ACTN|nr:cytochrome P450 [Streptomyces sulfonofaciens]GHH86907.1 cytochrome P450 [Streptomyces sulfonofaciens]